MVEVIVALLAFSVALAGLCQLANISKESTDRARDHYIAANIGKNRMEQSGSLEFGELYLLEESGVVVDHRGTPAIGGKFQRTTVISQVNSNLAEIVVTVKIAGRSSLSWTAADAGQEVIRTYYANFQTIVE